MSKAINNNAEIIRKCWNDPEFKKQLLAQPIETLKSIGVTIEEGVDVKVLEDTETLLHFVIPSQSANLDDDDLSSVAGGIRFGGAYTG